MGKSSKRRLLKAFSLKSATHKEADNYWAKVFGQLQKLLRSQRTRRLLWLSLLRNSPRRKKLLQKLKKRYPPHQE